MIKCIRVDMGLAKKYKHQYIGYTYDDDYDLWTFRFRTADKSETLVPVGGFAFEENSADDIIDYVETELEGEPTVLRGLA